MADEEPTEPTHLTTDNYDLTYPTDNAPIDTAGDFKNLAENVDAAIASLAATDLPLGSVTMWYGDPANLDGTGWALCDGGTKNGVTTPDLRGKIPMGVGTVLGANRALGTTGGDEEAVQHNHSASTSLSGGSHNHGLIGYQVGTDTGPPVNWGNWWCTGLQTTSWDYPMNRASAASGITASTSTGNYTSTNKNGWKNVPPVLYLHFIMKTGEEE